MSGIFNVGSGQARSFGDLISALFRATGHAPLIEYVDMPEALRAKYQYFTQADLARLRAAGYSAPPTPIEEGVAHYRRRSGAPFQVVPRRFRGRRPDARLRLRPLMCCGGALATRPAAHFQEARNIDWNKPPYASGSEGEGWFRNPTPFPDGTWYLFNRRWLSKEESPAYCPEPDWRVVVRERTDGGRSWSNPATVAAAPDPKSAPDDFPAAINCYLTEYNYSPKPFTWTADPDRIIAANREYQALDHVRLPSSRQVNLWLSLKRLFWALPGKAGGTVVETTVGLDTPALRAFVRLGPIANRSRVARQVACAGRSPAGAKHWCRVR